MPQSTPRRRGDAIIRPVAKALNSIYKFFVLLFLSLSVAMVLIISTDVILRQFGKGIVWADEMSRMLMIWMAFIAMAMGVEIGSHVEISLFFGWLPKKFQKIWATVNYVITMAIGCFLMYFGVGLIQIGQRSKLEIVRALPKSMLYLTIPIGGFFIFYFALMHMLKREDLLPSALENIYPKKRAGLTSCVIPESLETEPVCELPAAPDQQTKKTEGPGK